MDLLNDLLEALKPSEYRKFVKGWDKTKYEEMFRKYTNDRKAYRIYIPLKGAPKHIAPDPEVEKAVREAGYEIEDYVAGIASKDEGKRKIKIGKLLKDPKLQQKFANDPKRASAKNVENYVVISRHPYDIAGMSTDRGWRSCMNLHDGINKHYVPIDIKEGTLVAYLVKADDKNINKPIARVLIKPFVNTDKNAEADKKVALGVEDRVYGTPMSGFRETVMKWVDEVNDSKKLDGIFEFNKNLYNDGGTKDFIGVGPSGKLYQMVKNDPMKIGEIDDPSPELVKLSIRQSNGASVGVLKKNPGEDQLIYAVNRFGYGYGDSTSRELKIVQHMVKMGWMTDRLKTEILTEFPEGITVLSDVTDEMLIKAIDRNSHIFTLLAKHYEDKLEDHVSWKVIKHALDEGISPDEITNPSEKVQKYVLDMNIRNASQLRTISKNVLKAVVEKNPKVLDYVRKDLIDDDLAEIAFSKDPNAIKHLKNHTEKHVKTALDHNIENIRHVDSKYHTEEQQLRAVEHNLNLYKYIKNPSEKVMLKFLEEGGRYSFLKGHTEGEISEKVMLAALEKFDRSDYGNNAHLFSDAPKSVQMKFAENDPRTIIYFNHPDKEAIITAITKDPTVIKRLNHEQVSHEIAREIIKKVPAAVRFVDDPTESELVQAITADPYIVRDLKKEVMTDKILALAASKDWRVLSKLDDDEYDTFPEVVQVAAVKSFNPNHIDHYIDEFCELFRKDFSPRALLMLIKKEPMFITDVFTKWWTKEAVEYAMTHGDHDFHEKIYKRLVDLLKVPSKRNWGYMSRDFSPAEAKKKFDKDWMLKMKEIVSGKKEEMKAVEAAQKAQKAVKLQFLDSKDDPKYKKIWDFVKAHKPIEDVDNSIRYYEPSKTTYKNTYTRILKLLFTKPYSREDILRLPRADWKFDEAWVLPNTRTNNSHTPIIGFFKDGEVVGYVNLHSGYAWYPTKDGHKKPTHMRPSKSDEVMESKKSSFKEMLNEAE